MRNELATASSANNALAPFEPGRAILPRATFAKGLALIAAAQSKALEPDVTAAFWLALCYVDERDFPEGVRLALRHERFLTPAAVAEWCDAARDERLAKERAAGEREQEIAEAKERERYRRERAARRAGLERDRATWTSSPVTADDLHRRLLVVLELEGQPSLRRSVEHCRPSGTPDEFVLLVPEGDRVRLVPREVVAVERHASALCEREIRVLVEGQPAAFPRETRK